MKKHKKPGETHDQHRNHKNIKPKEKKDFNTDHLTNLEHGTIVKIYLKTPKTRKSILF